MVLKEKDGENLFRFCYRQIFKLHVNREVVSLILLAPNACL